MSKRAGVRRFGAPIVVTALAVTVALLFGGTEARAAGCTTTPTTDAALMTAVSTGSAGDVICLNANQQYSPTAPLDVKHSLTIETDPAQLSVPGNRAGTISGSLVAGGASNLDPNLNDVLVVASQQTLTLQNIVETQAIQQSNGGVVVLSGGTALIDHSLFSGNTSNAIDVKAGGQATITNSTITNSIQGFDGILLGGTASLNEDTIAGNTGDGIDKTAGATATVNNTILANNGLANCNTAVGLSGSHSGDSGASCGATITTGGFSGTSAVLGALANNGGPTNTLALLAGSPAINTGTAAPTGADDQRGFLRDANPDIGAYEVNGTAPATLFVIKHVVGPAGSAPSSAFTMTVTGASPNPGSFPGQDTPGTQVTVASGQPFNVTESGAQTGNYTESDSAGCHSTGGIAAGQTGTCTITNTAKPTMLTVIKHVDNTGNPACPGATCGTAADFTMTVKDVTAGNTTIASFSGAESPGSPAVAVPAGDVYTVTESADAAQAGKYNQSGTTAGCSGTATINGTVSCTITNTYITCAQPANSGPQPAPGNPGSSSNTCVNANISATIQVTSPTSVTFPALAVGQTSSAVSVPVTVYTNDATGYNLTVKRTRFYPVATAPNDQILSISSTAVGGSQAFLAPFTGSLAPIPSDGTSLNLGHGSTNTPVSGDAWPFSFVLGPIQFGPPAGQYQSVVTFTAVGL